MICKSCGKDQNITVGIDIISVKRFHNFDFKGNFAKKIFTDKELAICKKKSYPEQSLAGRFAAKEAVKKTIQKTIGYNRIEIRSDKNGQPLVKYLEEEIDKNYHTILSISHTEDLAQAISLTFTK